MAEEKSNGKSWLKIVIPIVATIIIGGASFGATYTINRVDKNYDDIAELGKTVREEYVDKESYEKDLDEIKKKLDFLIELELKEDK